MEHAVTSFARLGASSKQAARVALRIGENRLQLLMVEVQEERDRLLHTFFLALGTAAVGLLAGFTLTAAIVVLCWSYSPVTTLLALTGFYASIGVFLAWRLVSQIRRWQTLSSTLDQLRKDRACLETLLA